MWRLEQVCGGFKQTYTYIYVAKSYLHVRGGSLTLPNNSLPYLWAGKHACGWAVWSSLATSVPKAGVVYTNHPQTPSKHSTEEVCTHLRTGGAALAISYIEKRLQKNDTACPDFQEDIQFTVFSVADLFNYHRLMMWMNSSKRA